jgi:hypothetical protein
MRRLVLVFGIIVSTGLAGAAQSFNQRPPTTPAETLLEPAILKAIDDAKADDGAAVEIIQGTDPAAGEILLSCYAGDNCSTNIRTGRTLRRLIDAKTLAQPTRTIRFITLSSPAGFGELIAKDPSLPSRVKAALNVGLSRGTSTLHIFRSPWSAATIADEVVELFARQAPYGTVAGAVNVAPFQNIGQPRWESYGIPALSLTGGVEGSGRAHAAFVTAATAYFLGTLPNAGAEALLSHLTVGAHARLAEDGRKAVAQMGSQQRASADVLIMFGQAIEREQRRMRSFERFMPSPVDPMLRSRLTDMEKGITGVWTSMGLTSSPFVPAAERIRGRGGEDRRVPTRTGKGPLEPGAAAGQLAILKTPSSREVIYEAVNFIDGKRSISDIRDAVSGEFGNVPLGPLVEYFELLAKTGVISLK